MPPLTIFRKHSQCFRLSLTKVGTGGVDSVGQQRLRRRNALSGGTLNVNNAALALWPAGHQRRHDDRQYHRRRLRSRITPRKPGMATSPIPARDAEFARVTMTADTQITIPAVSGNNQALTINGVISGNFVLTRWNGPFVHYRSKHVRRDEHHRRSGPRGRPKLKSHRRHGAGGDWSFHHGRTVDRKLWNGGQYH